MLTLKSEHVRIIEYSSKINFFERVRAKLREFDPTAAKTPEAELDAFIERHYQVAKQYDLISEKQCMVWIFVTWVWGEDIVEKHSYIHALLDNHLADADAKAEGLWRWHIQQDLLRKETLSL
ncbi:hypothetical protein [Acanthopleuribacter pedis]|uniref:Uncharacterized protein n=1 Tax=Acanthopleuribacter pedis TaxID=442870 RepID=A0A8J7Q923_9BACT|nr:hypothetical protein [Acanthopleuribacter pedis]MBO1319674.1 hypothetical protein [Acanthopleuribacter pedis]